MAALLGKAGVIDDQGLHPFVAGDGRQHTLANAAQHCLVGPGGLRHKVQQRLVLGV
jgi:hypothetical protein